MYMIGHYYIIMYVIALVIEMVQTLCYDIPNRKIFEYAFSQALIKQFVQQVYFKSF